LYENNFHGRTTTIIVVFKNAKAKLWFYRRFYKIAYDDLDALAAALKSSSILQDS
jgi:acetylornithine/succinyldiaminopimelate/putrescine aminotransferase